MGSSQSRLETTAEDLWVTETAKKGMYVMGTTLLAPFVVIACPIVGAYEYGTAVEDELLTGSYLVDGAIGFLLGVLVSPIAPFFVLWESTANLFGRPPLPFSPSGSDHYERASSHLGLDSQNFYNVAVAGCPGTGKSSLVNALLGYRDGQPRAAPVREAGMETPTITSIEPQGYQHPVLHTLMLWDLPGITFRGGKQYFEDHCLGAFDAILLVSGDRLMAADIKLARMALRYNIPIFFIRNKADAALKSKLRRISARTDSERWGRAVGELTEEIEKTMCRSMRRFGFSTESLYIVSAWTIQEFVISLIQRRMTRNLQLIHEKLLITNLLDAISDRRRKRSLMEL
ncbi:P-loop containing nucleoside triphosphate hydrolase protein [Dichotomocladium elegans]|nr:P-loop containing nucleoside triphosphate hydrolase protein [Dichotomocladium elegans]